MTMLDDKWITLSDVSQKKIQQISIYFAQLNHQENTDINRIHFF